MRIWQFVRQTFQEVGWEIAIDEVQLGWNLDLLGFAISTQGDGCMSVPEAKRRGMIADAGCLLEAAAKGERGHREKRSNGSLGGRHTWRKLWPRAMRS